jgi:circadian clock protein KaiC
MLVAMPPETVSTGVSTLDSMLGGGLPRQRAVLVTGSPGTGKSTLGMQFLQAGLDAGDDCLFISTEQTIEELRASFADFAFDLDHDALDIASIHATPGRTIDGDDAQLVLSTLDGEGVFGGGEGFAAPFTGEYVMQYLDQYGPCDRVVFDSVSGLSAVAEDDERFRRSVLDLIRYFTDEGEATALLTAEDRDDDPTTEALRFTTHGVVELGRQRVADDTHLFVEVTKMRGVRHDRRRAELQFTDDGLRVGPERRSQPPALKDHSHSPIGIEGLDQLCGGGLVRGAGVLLEHDGQGHQMALFSALFADAIDRGEAITLVPTVGLRQSRLATMLDGHGESLRGLLDSDRLFVVDAIGGWDGSLPNVRTAPETSGEYVDLLADLGERTDRTQFTLVNADAVVHTLGPEEARRARYAQESALVGPDDRLVHVTNPSVIGDDIAAFYMDVAEQALRTWIEDDGLQYLTLRKSPCGFVGTTSLVEYVTDPPYLRVGAPPRDRENPAATD